MGVLSPYDVQGIMQMLDAIQKAEGGGDLPPGSTDRFVADMRSDFEYSGRSPARSANEGFTGAIGNPKPVRAPWRGEYDMPGNFERAQHMANSLANDAMLRKLLGSSRQRTEADDVEGTFALAKYPGIEQAIMQAEAGLPPPGMLTPMGGTEEQHRFAAGRRQWGRKQRELLGMDRRIGAPEWKGYLAAAKGLGARERRDLFRNFLRG